METIRACSREYRADGSRNQAIPLFVHMNPPRDAPALGPPASPSFQKKARFHHEEMGRIVVPSAVGAVGAGDRRPEPRTRPGRSGRCWSSAGAATTTRTRRTSSPGASPGARPSSGPSPTTPTRPPRHKNPVYDNPDWAKGFDVIVHDECSSQRQRHGLDRHDPQAAQGRACPASSSTARCTAIAPTAGTGRSPRRGCSSPA